VNTGAAFDERRTRPLLRVGCLGWLAHAFASTAELVCVLPAALHIRPYLRCKLRFDVTKGANRHPRAFSACCNAVGTFSTAMRRARRVPLKACSLHCESLPCCACGHPHSLGLLPHLAFAVFIVRSCAAVRSSQSSVRSCTWPSPSRGILKMLGMVPASLDGCRCRPRSRRRLLRRRSPRAHRAFRQLLRDRRSHRRPCRRQPRGTSAGCPSRSS
jgi:hypothetical protein